MQWWLREHGLSASVQWHWFSPGAVPCCFMFIIVEVFIPLHIRSVVMTSSAEETKILTCSVLWNLRVSKTSPPCGSEELRLKVLWNLLIYSFTVLYLKCCIYLYIITSVMLFSLQAVIVVYGFYHPHLLNQQIQVSENQNFYKRHILKIILRGPILCLLAAIFSFFFIPLVSSPS